MASGHAQTRRLLLKVDLDGGYHDCVRQDVQFSAVARTTEYAMNRGACWHRLRRLKVRKLHRQPAHTVYVYRQAQHQYFGWYATVADAGDDGCRHVTVLERCAACRSSDVACGPYNTTSGFPDAHASCLEINDTLYATPWCQAAAEQMFPACSCLASRPLPTGECFLGSHHCSDLGTCNLALANVQALLH